MSHHAFGAHHSSQSHVHQRPVRTRAFDALPRWSMWLLLYVPLLAFILLVSLSFLIDIATTPEGSSFTDPVVMEGLSAIVAFVVFFGVMCGGFAPTMYPRMTPRFLRAKVMASPTELTITTWGSSIVFVLWGLLFSVTGVFLIVGPFAGVGWDSDNWAWWQCALAIGGGLLIVALSMGAYFLAGKRVIHIAPDPQRGMRTMVWIRKGWAYGWRFPLVGVERIWRAKTPSGRLPSQNRIYIYARDVVEENFANRSNPLRIPHVELLSDHFMGLDADKLVMEISRRVEVARAHEQGNQWGGV